MHESGTVGKEVSKEALEQWAREHAWIHRVQWNGIIFAEGKDCRITDINGKTYLDARSGYTSIGIGWGRKEIADAAYAQLQKLHFGEYGATTVPTVMLARKLAQIAPGTLSRTIFCSGGSEANETALKIAKAYQRVTGSQNKYKVIARIGSYHGGTYAMMSLEGRPGFPRWIYEPLMPGVRFVAAPYCYRCPFNLEYPSCGVECAKAIEQLIQFEGPETVSAVIGEPVSAASGGQIPPPEYWSMIRSICDKYGVLLIADEVITAFGRLGKMFGCQHWGYVPDIITVAKGLSSSYTPAGAAITRKEIADQFVGEGKEPFDHVLTFGGNPVSCAVCLANLKIIEREKLVENAAHMGEYLLEQLRSLEKHPMVGEVRGLGLLVHIELVKDKKTKEPFKKEDAIAAKYSKKCRGKGLISQVIGPAIQISPMLIVTKGEIDEIVTIIDKVLDEMEAELGMA